MTIHQKKSKIKKLRVQVKKNEINSTGDVGVDVGAEKMEKDSEQIKEVHMMIA